MIKSTLLALVLIGGLAATSFALGAFSTPESPCVCCGADCTCEDCVCDELGCACETGGPCACDTACRACCCGG